MKKVLVTGGTGYIGSHTIVDLLQHGFEVISIDNLSRSSGQAIAGIERITGTAVRNYAVDLCDAEQTRQVFRDNPGITGIIHFAAYKTVPESVALPLMYYENNMYSLINILRCIEEFNIPNFVFSSSCSVYGNVSSLPVTEDTPMAKPECAYAASKQMGEQVILDLARVSRMNSILLRYFNPVGAHPSAHIGEVPFGKPNNLVPAITQTAIGILPGMKVWGTDYDTRDGSCIRDYIHVMDIAHAHTRALQYLVDGKQTSNFEVYNLGSGEGVTVLEAIHAFEKVSGQKLNYELGPRREGDVVAIYANNEKARGRLGWEPRYSLEDMMKSAWDWELKLESDSKTVS